MPAWLGQFLVFALLAGAYLGWTASRKRRRSHLEQRRPDLRRRLLPTQAPPHLKPEHWRTAAEYHERIAIHEEFVRFSLRNCTLSPSANSQIA